MGAGIAGIVYLKFQYFQSITNIQTFMFYGGLAGAGAQRGVEAVFNYVIYPLGRFMAYYEKLVELDLHRHFHRISEEQYKAINEKLTEERFLGKVSQKQLPPAS